MKLTQLQRLGLEIMYTPGNQKSYKKLLPAIRAFPEATVVTVDDDIFYPRHWLRGLLHAARSTPDTIFGYRGNVATVTGSGRFKPYQEWPPADRNTPPSELILTGVGGILYPKRSLHPDVADWRLAAELCPTADDLWFKAMALRIGSETRLVRSVSANVVSVRGSSVAALFNTNVDNGQNDKQWAALVRHFNLRI